MMKKLLILILALFLAIPTQKLKALENKDIIGMTLIFGPPLILAARTLHYFSPHIPLQTVREIAIVAGITTAFIGAIPATAYATAKLENAVHAYIKNKGKVITQKPVASEQERDLCSCWEQLILNDMKKP